MGDCWDGLPTDVKEQLTQNGLTPFRLLVGTKQLFSALWMIQNPHLLPLFPLPSKNQIRG